MTAAKKYFILGIVIIAIAAIGVLFIVYRLVQQPQNNENISNSQTALQDISTPNDWYSHRLNGNNIIFTKQSQLPAATGTEVYAYGEQINVSAVPFSGSLTDWANSNVGDNVLAPTKTWSDINGHQVLQTEVNGEAGKTLNYVIFGSSTAYVFFLYPEVASDTQVLASMVNSLASSF